ncbi:MAG: TIM-barrel domain-containing protein [Anaerolineae bacterium]
MKQSTCWDEFATELDFMSLPVARHAVRRWVRYEKTADGVLFHCETASGAPMRFRASVVRDDVVRFRVGPELAEMHDSEMLVPDALGAETCPFKIEGTEETVVLSTARMRVVFSRFPWQVRVYAKDAEFPFFAERIDDRAYGPAYETPPLSIQPREDGRRVWHEAVAVQPGEAFYGFGEQFNALDKWGREIVSWAIDCGNVTSTRSYKNVPFFMSSAGYGLFIHSSAPIVYRVGSESAVTYSFDVLDDELDYFLIHGPRFKHILARYTELTGRAPLLPKWSFGFWISRCGYKTRAEVEAIIDEMRARGFPCDVISLDPWWMGEAPWCSYEWDTEQFPDPQGMMAALRERGVRTCLWITPYVTSGTHAYEEGVEQGYFLTDAEGALAPVEEAFTGARAAAVDFTNPEARAWFQRVLARLLEMGAAVFKTDFAEQAPTDALYHDGRDGLTMHNLYPLLYNGAVFELTARKFGRGLTWGRSGYAGSQRYPVQWGGDSYASFDQMVGQMRGLLSYGMSGVPFCSHDVGGFDCPPRVFDACMPEGATLPGDTIAAWWDAFGENFEAASADRDAEVYIRWLQFGVFSSHLRAHGKQPREPWEYGPEATKIAHRYLTLRYRLLPYIYTQAARSCETGLPMVRPLVLDYQEDPNVAQLDLEYLFGDSLLVAPLFTHAHERQVYLPAGRWVDYWSKEVVEGGRWITVEAPLEKLPLWVKAGHIIPLGPMMDYVDQKPLDPLTLEIYAPEDAGELIIRDEDQPDIVVRYAREDGELRISVTGAPGDVKVHVFGEDVPWQLVD